MWSLQAAEQRRALQRILSAELNTKLGKTLCLANID
jgi:hypothetical protein